MVQHLRLLLLALVLTGTCWAGAEAISLSEFIFGAYHTNSSLTSVDQSPSHHIHHQNHQSTEEDDELHISQNHRNITHNDKDKTHDNTHNHGDSHIHHQTHNHHHNQSKTQHLNTHDTHHHTHNHHKRHHNQSKTQHLNTHDTHHHHAFRFKDPMGLYQRRQSNQWSGRDNNPSKPPMQPNFTNDKHSYHNHYHNDHSGKSHSGSPHHRIPIMPYPYNLFGNHHHHTSNDAHNYLKTKTHSHIPAYPHYYHDPNYHSHPIHPHHHPHSHEHTPHRYHDHNDMNNDHEPLPYSASFHDHPHYPPPPPPPPPPPTECPLLYTRVADRCIAIFSIARMAWNDAKLFCDGIFGELLAFDDAMEFYHMVDFLKKAGVSSSYWTGGHGSATGWYWVGNSKLMTLGTPFWAVRNSGGKAIQAPTTDITNHDKWCAAMNSKDFYYLRDVKCTEKKSPVCVLRQDAEVVVALGTTNYYPALDKSFEVWNRINTYDDDNDRYDDDYDDDNDDDYDDDEDDDDDDDSSEEKYEDEHDDDSSEEKYEDEDDKEDDEDANKDAEISREAKEEDEVEMEIEGGGEEEEEVKEINIEENKEDNEEDFREGEEDSTITEVKEAKEETKDDQEGGSGSGMGEIGDDEDMAEGSGNTYHLETGSGVELLEDKFIHSMFMV